MTDDEHVDKQWTAEAREEFERAAADLQAAIAKHAAVIAAAQGERQVAGIFQANGELAEAAEAYIDAQFELTGTLPSFETDDDDDDDDSDDEDDITEMDGVMVLRRSFYAVASEPDVLEAGRQAYQRVWPDDTREDAEADVTDLGRALYQVAHDAGWDALNEADGLRPLGGTTWVVGRTRPYETATTDPEDFIDSLADVPFEIDDESRLIYRQDDVY